MLSMGMMKWMPAALLVIAVAYIYHSNELRGKIIEQMKVDMVQQAYEISDKMSKEWFNGSVRDRKNQVVKELKYDTSKAVDINSTRFYIK